jgi:hypothetical protein
MVTINRLEDIYPLTIVSMKYEKLAIINANSNAHCISFLEDDEETQYEPHDYMESQWGNINYGIGETIETAFQDYKNRLK